LSPWGCPPGVPLGCPGFCWVNVWLLAPLIQPKNYGLNCDFIGIGERDGYRYTNRVLAGRTARPRWTLLLPPRSHARPSCGPQAWYVVEDIATAVSPYPCPWCGGEAGTPAHYSVLNTVAGRIYPAPDIVAPDERGGLEIIVVHPCRRVLLQGLAGAKADGLAVISRRLVQPGQLEPPRVVIACC